MTTKASGYTISQSQRLFHHLFLYDKIVCASLTIWKQCEISLLVVLIKLGVSDMFFPVMDVHSSFGALKMN